MNTSGEVADLMVKEGIQITESAAKLAGLGAKNLAAIIMALLQEDNKLQGKTNLKQLLKSDKPLCILQIKEQDIHKFNKEAKKYGVLFTAVADKTHQSEFCDIIAKQEDVAKLNYIMEKMGYASPNYSMSEKAEEQPEKHDKSEDSSKKSRPRANERQSGKKYTSRGENSQRRTENARPSVKGKVAVIKARSKANAKKSPERRRTGKEKSRG